MKKNIFKLFGFLLIISLCACSDENVEIKTLSKFGEQFYFGEKVVVWAGAETKNATDVSYKWECDGGSFIGPQYLFENLWVAPFKPGIYTVKVTATVGKNVSTRETKMKVAYFFQENFDNNLNLATWSSSLTTLTYDVTKYKAKCLGTSTGIGYFYRLSTDTLTIPFSVFSNAGFETMTTTGTNNYMRYALYFSAPNDVTTPFIREIRWEFRPKASGNNLKVNYETYQLNTAKSTFYDIVLDGVNPLGAMDVNSYENFSLSISADTILFGYRNNQEVFNSDAIRTWLRAHPNEKPVCNQIRWSYPGKNVFWFDDFYIVNDGTILKTKPE